MNAIEGYASATSVLPGETIAFYVSAQSPYFNLTVDFLHLGNVEVLVLRDQFQAMSYPTPSDAYQSGCEWPPAYTLTIPDTWPSGLYAARISSTPSGSATATMDIRFVVKARARNSNILFQIQDTTFQGYNGWGGKSFYGDPAVFENRARKVSYNRPALLSGAGATVAFGDWEYPFVKWLENNGFVAEYCTSIDLHKDPALLNSYQLLLSVGHDEYWSREMRDNVEAFIANGGNTAFFSGNVCWWQVRFEDDCRTLVCYKSASEDPLNGVDNTRVTVNWYDVPVGRPENHMTGVSYNHGGGWYDTVNPRPHVGYCVQASQHWVFAGTGLNDNDVFGKENSIVGYEADGAQFANQGGPLKLSGSDGTPSNFLILATADLSGWTPPTNWNGYDQKGCATMGIYQNNGVVFTAATTHWINGLDDTTKPVSQITFNVVQHLQQVASTGGGIDGYDLTSTADRAFAFDCDGSGKPDHLVLYRPGTGSFWIVQNSAGGFEPFYTPGTPATGIGGYDLASPADCALAFDYDGSGKLDHLVLYRPGTGTIWILKNTAGAFDPVYTPGTPAGIGGYDLASPADQVFAFDYDSSGKLDHLVLYRPGTGTIWILKNTAGTFNPVYTSFNPFPGIGGYNLRSPADQVFAFDYDGSGKLDHLALYRPGTGIFWILKNSAGMFAPVYGP